MRGMRGIHRNCRRCGKPFDVDGTCGRKCYCSKECADAARKEWYKIHYSNWYQKNKEKLRVKPHEITCARCGEKFLGKYRQKYCPACVNSGDSYMNQIRDQRSTDFTLWEV